MKLQYKIEKSFYESMRIHGIEQQNIKLEIKKLVKKISRCSDTDHGEFIYLYENDSDNYGIYGLVDEKNIVHINILIKAF